MLNRTRQIYQQILKGNKPSNSDVEVAIQIGEQFKALVDTPAWKQVQTFIDRQREGAREYMEFEASNVNGITIVKLFNAFIKYWFFLMENRGYRKLEKYIEVTIAKAEEYAKQQAIQAEREAKKAQRQAA